MSTPKNTLVIDENKYEIIEGTQSDGRCFSASVYYDLYNKIPSDTDDEFNVWIQTNIIDPILATEDKDCIKFLKWATIWAGLKRLNNDAKLSQDIDDINNIQDIIERLNGIQEQIYNFNNADFENKEFNQDIYKVIDFFKDFFYKMKKNFVILQEDTFKEQLKKVSDDFDYLSNKIISFDIDIMTKTLLDKIENVNDNDNDNDNFDKIDKYLEEFVNTINQILETIYYDIQSMKEKICDKAKETTSYQNIITKYKKYVDLLNKKTKDGYEWTEPNTGPIDVLLDFDKINSINIYNSIRNNKFVSYNSKTKEDEGKDLYLYYENENHYKPLILIDDTPETTITDENIIQTETKTDEIKTGNTDTNVNPIETKTADETKTDETKTADETKSKTNDTKKNIENISPTNKTSQILSAIKKYKNLSKIKLPKISTIKKKLLPIGVALASKIVTTSNNKNDTTTNKTATTTNKNDTTTNKNDTTTNKNDTTTNKNVDTVAKNTTNISKHIKTITNKNDKIPNSLIIYIKTRIPNFFKMNYEPYMSVPKSKSHTVYFDPLVKYYEGPIKNLPSGVPKNKVVTQFFEASEFDSMINRILSDFRYMQKPRTFEEAYDEHIIENNLNITIKNLFKPNGLFYINQKPYTIVGVKSNKYDWQIDKKPLEKLLNQFSYLSVKQLQEEANKEEEDIPEILRQRNVASSNIVENENISFVTSGLKNASKKSDKKLMEKEISGVTDSFIPYDKLPDVSSDILDLYTKYLRENYPINYSDNIDLARDPLTLSLLVDPSDLLNFINKNKKSTLIDFYSAFTNSKINLLNANKSYKELCVELAQYKTVFDNEIKNINLSISKEEEKQNVNELMLKISQLKVGYMQIMFKMADAINEIYQQQKLYFVSSKALLEGLKDDYINIIEYYETPVLALKCIEYDIVNMNSLITLDNGNPYSVAYHKNYNVFKHFYENQLYKNKKALLEPVINFADDFKNYKNNYVLLIEKEQYEIYNFKMYLTYSYNETDIWVLLFKSIELFINSISLDINNIILQSDSSLTSLLKDYDVEQQKSLLKELGVEGIQSDYDKSLKQFNWFLVKDDGARAVVNKTHKPFEQLYLDYIKKSVKAYDAIILYIYLLEIFCLRQNRVYVAEENVNQINLEYSLTLEKYYDNIIKNIEPSESSESFEKEIYIPETILWDVKELNNIDVVENKMSINAKSNLIYRARIKSISESRNNLISSCEKISEIITPNISKSGFIQQCINIIKTKPSNIIQHNFKTNYWISETIKNYDIQGTNNFIYNMEKVVRDAWFDMIIDDINVDSYLDWLVFDNEQSKIDSLYAAIANGLNGQLQITNSETTNPYAEEINGKNVFTFESIKQLVLEINQKNDIPYDLSDYKNNLMILEKTLQIKFILFEMFTREDKTNNVGDLVLYKNKPHRITLIKEDQNGVTLYNLYNGFIEIEDVEQEKTSKFSNNLLYHFRVSCNTSLSNPDDYMYIVMTKHTNEKNETYDKFQLVQYINRDYVFKYDTIPIYIKYLIFNSCPELDKDKLSTHIDNMGFGKIKEDIIHFEDSRRKNIEEENIRGYIDDVEKQIKKYKKKLENYKKSETKSLIKEQSKELLYKEEIRGLKERRKNVTA